MAIDAIGGLSPYGTVHGAAFASPREFRETVIESASKALGLSSKNVKFAFANGMSLADLARMRGIAKSELVTAVADGIRSLDTTSGGLPGAPDPVEMAQRIAERPGGLRGDRQQSGLGAILDGASGNASVPPLVAVPARSA